MAERRVREREQLRGRIIDAARDLLLEQGLNGVSMRAIAERVEYSAATIYIYFKDKDELIRQVVHTGFERLGESVAVELAQAGSDATAAEQYAAMGRAYARFGLANPAYFRVMFELPGTASFECAESDHDHGGGFVAVEEMVRRAVAAGQFGPVDPRVTALVGWGVIHGLTTLYLSGHLSGEVATHEEFIVLIERAIASLYNGWRPQASGEGV